MHFQNKILRANFLLPTLLNAQNIPPLNTFFQYGTVWASRQSFFLIPYIVGVSLAYSDSLIYCSSGSRLLAESRSGFKPSAESGAIPYAGLL
jgi:hypothetical protein